MNEQTEQTISQPDAVPARIQLDDFIEAVTRGVTRALAAQEDVSGYAIQPGGFTRSIANPTVLVGIIAPPSTTYPTDLAELLAGQGITFKRS